MIILVLRLGQGTFWSYTLSFSHLKKKEIHEYEIFKEKIPLKRILNLERLILTSNVGTFKALIL